MLAKSSEFAEVNKHFAEESSQIRSIDSAVSELQKIGPTDLLEVIDREADFLEGKGQEDLRQSSEFGGGKLRSDLVNCRPNLIVK